MQNPHLFLETTVDPYSVNPSPLCLIVSTALEQLQAHPLIGTPVAMIRKGQKVYEFPNLTPVHMAYVKGVRAVSTLNAIRLLIANGYTLEAGTLIRCILDCTTEIAFILETYPEYSPKVAQLMEVFKESPLSENEQDVRPVLSKDLINARVRSQGLTYQHPDYEKLRKALTDIYRTYSGYVHSAYHHVMEVFNSHKGKFDTNGILEVAAFTRYQPTLIEMEVMVASGIWEIAYKVGDKKTADLIAAELVKYPH